MPKSGTILIVDDNRGIRRTLEILLPPYFSRIKTIPSPVTLDSAIRELRPDVVLLDMNFSAGPNTGGEGLYTLSHIKEAYQGIEVVLFTAYADVGLAVEGMKRGAFDFIVKPWDNGRLISVLTSARDKAMRGASAAKSPDRAEFFWGTGPVMEQIRSTVAKVAPTDATILITGENGTGKDMLARYIYSASLRKNEPFVAVDAGAIPEALFESELFGHLKGSFTDAISDHKGYFEQANGGTLFLDEVANIPLHLQAKLLRALQSRSVIPLGSAKAVPVDIRLICATNADLVSLVRQGKFREDLYYRINTIHISLPPLRERRDDIIPLAELFMQRFAIRYHRPLNGISPDARELLLSRRWGGNVRELENCMEKAVILSDGRMLFAADIGDEEVGTVMETSADEKSRLEDVMRRSGGNISAAARLLGVSRPTLYAKLKKYGL